jgi:DNA invertase Pin-like site-specific DNA recombinase
VCFKLDRLGRSVAHLALLMEELIKLHVPLIVITQGIDTSEDNAAGRLQAHVIMAMAEFERSLISRPQNNRGVPGVYRREH